MENEKAKAEQTVIFLHIPKTAGSTLQQVINQHYPKKTIYTVQRDGSIDDFKNLSISHRSEIRLLRGHYGFGLHKYLPQPSIYFTILRDPIERVISHYYYIRRKPEHYCYDLIESNDMSLKDFLESKADAIADNGQTRLLSGLLETGWEIEFGECTEEVLKAAKKNLRENFAVVGLTEEFDKTLLLLKEAFGWQNLFYTQQNVSPNRPSKEDLSQDTVDAITKVSLLDLELYQYATELFREQIRRQGVLFAIKAARFRRANRRKSAHSSAKLQTPPKKSRVSPSPFRNVKHFDNNVPVPHIVIELYLSLDPVLCERWPDVGQATAGSFYSWLNAPADQDPRQGESIPIVTNLAYHIYCTRSDLQAAFPDVFGKDRVQYITWWLAVDTRATYHLDQAFTQDAWRSLLRWCDMPAEEDPHHPETAPVLTNLVAHIYRTHPDLHRIFPDPFGQDRFRLAHWFITYAQAEYALDEVFLEPIHRSVRIISQNIPETNDIVPSHAFSLRRKLSSLLPHKIKSIFTWSANNESK